MAKTAVRNTQQFIAEASTWPTIREVAEEWSVPERFVRSMVERRRVSAIRLDYIRVSPESWERFMAEAFRPGDF